MAMILLSSLMATTIAASGPSISHPAGVAHAGGKYTLTNGYVSVTFEEKLGGGGALSSLRGDFAGQGAYGEELLAGAGYTLDVAAADGSTAASSAEAQAGALTVKVLSSGPATAAILVEGLRAGTATESWALTLRAGDRGLELNTTGSMAADAQAGAVVRHSLLAAPLSVYGYYPADGVVQMMNAQRGMPEPGATHPLTGADSDGSTSVQIPRGSGGE